MTRPLPFGLLSLLLLSGNARGEEQWAQLGDYYVHSVRARGVISLNLEKLRRREGYFEIWERMTPLGDTHALPATVAPRPSEQLTLWAIRCRSGVMAKITEGKAGAFEPRAEQLRFFLPAPSSSGAAVIEATCAEIRRQAGENRRTSAGGEMAGVTPGRLEHPPAILEDDALESELEQEEIGWCVPTESNR